MKNKSDNKSLATTNKPFRTRRGNNSIDWNVIMTDYISDDSASYASLAKKYDVSLRAVTDKGNEKQWVKLRQDNVNKALAEVEAKALEIRRARNEAHIDISMRIQDIAEQQLNAGIVPKNARDLINWVDSSIKIEREARGMTAKQQSLTIGSNRGQSIRLEWGNGSAVEPH